MRGGVRFVVPAGIDDPDQVSGGNVYDREVRDGLQKRGWTVDLVETADRADAGAALSSAPDGSLALVDGLVADRAPEALEAEGDRIRIVVLAHMLAAAFPDADPDTVEAERRSLRAASAVVTTSRWTADELVARGLADREHTTVAVPGAHEAILGAGQGRNLLCVGVIAPHKGQDILLEALAQLSSSDWNCSIVGSPDHFPRYARCIARAAARFDGRVRMIGVLGPDTLAEEYHRSALLVAPSRVESAGMAITDARARGIPVIASAVGGIPDTVAGGGALLVRPNDPAALARQLGAWIMSPSLRDRLRHEAALARRATPRWEDTVTAIEQALARS
jgi:glycosyltransferase involved in cell wall biosynthesis